MNYSWDFAVLLSFIPAFLRGLWVTLYVSAASIAGGSVLGIIIAVLTRSHYRLLRSISTLYINLFLAFPVLVLLIWLYFCLPVFTGIAISSELTAILALTLSLAGFVGDILRGGIDSIPKGQSETARVLGLTRWQTMRRIVLPQAIKVMIPPILGQYITCIKLSALASVIAVYELVHTANNINSQTYKPLETYTFVAVLYLILILPLVQVMRFFERRSIKGIELERGVDTIRKFLLWFRGA